MVVCPTRELRDDEGLHCSQRQRLLLFLSFGNGNQSNKVTSDFQGGVTKENHIKKELIFSNIHEI